MTYLAKNDGALLFSIYFVFDKKIGETNVPHRHLWTDITN
jgi:hypothetical protein